MMLRFHLHFGLTVIMCYSYEFHWWNETLDYMKYMVFKQSSKISDIAKNKAKTNNKCETLLMAINHTHKLTVSQTW